MSSHNYENILGHCIDALRSTKELSDKYLENDEEAKKVIQDVTKKYAEYNFEKEKVERALKQVKNELEKVAGGNIDIDALYSKYMSDDLTELIHTHSDVWKEIYVDAAIQEIQVKNKSLSDAHFEKLDDSLLCANVFKPPIDPISKVLIKVPYKSTICGHYFDYDTILKYIKERKGRAKCPYMGCANLNFRAEHLRLDERMKQMVSAYLESHKDSDNSSDDE